ncbi:MFS transporter [Massilia sp. LXY-6]|uniref:MFS transporter n=1 Tax=Massilia sp. LXY-6 TaxID=3379823 RepID=UPI003EE0C99F
MKLPALVALTVLAHTAFGGGRVALTLSAIRLGGTPFEVGLVLSLLAVVPMFLSVHAGRWTDRSGVARPTLLALLMLEAGLLLALLPALAALGAAAVLLGCGYMLIHLAINNAVGKAGTAAQRTHGFSMLALGISTSTAAGPVIAGFLVDLAGHAWTFLTLAVLPVVALLIFARAGRAMPAVQVGARPAARLRMADLFRHAPLRAVFIASALLSMGWDLFTFMMPVHGDRIGLSASEVGLVMGAFGSGTFVVRLFTPGLARRFSEWPILGGALALSAAVYLLFPLLHAWPALLALGFLLGLGLGCALPMIMSAIGHSAPPGRAGEAIGVRSMLANVSQTLLPVSFGALGSAVGTQLVFWALAAMLAAGAVFAMGRHVGPADA